MLFTWITIRGNLFTRGIGKNGHQRGAPKTINISLINVWYPK